MFVTRRSQGLVKDLSKQCLVCLKRCSSTLDKQAILSYPLCKEEDTHHDFIEKEHYPGVTTVMAATKPPESLLALLRWKKKMIKQLGEEGFAQMQKETLDSGKACHHSIEECLGGIPFEDVQVPPTAKNLWQSVTPVVKCVTEVENVETRVCHPVLGYKGYIDCVAKYRDERCLIDWKTSNKRRYSLKDCYDDPVQIAAYVGALNASSPLHKQISKGLVVKIYHNGAPATTFNLNKFTMEYYWNQWLIRLVQYKEYINGTQQKKTNK